MPEPRQITGFVPRWLEGVQADELDEFMIGSIPDQDPRLITRLVPNDHGIALAARTVSRVIDLKQDLAYFAARDVAEGYNPNFTDLSSISKALRLNAALTVETSEVGSYVIPTSLPTRSTDLDAEAVLNRYVELLAAIDQPEKSLSVSIGALHVCAELGKLFKRDIDVMEVTTFDRENRLRSKVTLTSQSIGTLDRLLSKRRNSSAETELITGRLVALDVEKGEFQLKLANTTYRILGKATFFPISILRDHLGDTVTLEGFVVRDEKKITITACRIVSADN